MKWLLIGFIILQVGIDLAHSITAFPFVHYGMFSESFGKPDSLLVYAVIIDGKRLEASDFRVYRWDMVQAPLAGFEEEQRGHDPNSDQPHPGDNPVLVEAKLIYHSILPRQLENDDSLSVHFPQWYKQYLSRLLGRPVHSLQVEKAWYRYDGDRLQLLQKKTWINS
ncbi:MAG TPA: hypothetical protein VGN00_04915 [Puia sp.]|jgi:hypothetical protein